MRKGERTLRCLVHYLPTGIDFRLFEARTFVALSCAAMRPRLEPWPSSGRLRYALRVGHSFLRPLLRSSDDLWCLPFFGNVL